MAQDTEPLLGPLPDSVYPVGWPIGSSEAHGVDYETQELLHKPHAFALMHGDKGAKIAYGQLHWRVDCFTMVFMTDLLEVTVDDHEQHRHEHSHTHEIPPHTHPIPEEYGHAHGNTGAEIGGEATTSDADPVDTDVCKAVDIDEGTGAVSDSSDAGAHNKHTVKLPTITYCNQSSQEQMANMETTIPNLKEKGGEAMNPKWGDKKYHELDEYGTVYLVWQVDTEQGGSEVIACWVQVGEPEETSTVGAIGAGNSTTNRRNTDNPHLGTGEPEGDDENEDKGIFYIEIGTVEEDDHVEQKVSSDVNWTATVMDRELTTAVNTLEGLVEYSASP